MVDIKKQEQTNNSMSLSSLLLVDVGAGLATATAISPVVAVIDRSIIANMSGKTPLIAGLKEGFGTILTRPWVIMRQPSVLAVFGVYLATYTTANTVDTLCRHNSIPQVNGGNPVDPMIPKLAASSLVNISMTLWKDQLLTRWFGIGPVRPLPLVSYLLFSTRDAMTMTASFTLPPLMTAALTTETSDEAAAKKQKLILDLSTQLALPCAIQIISTPLHLLGLDFYNRPVPGTAGTKVGSVTKPTWAERGSKITSGYLPSTMARMARILPAFGVGGVLNKWCRSAWGSQ